MNLTISRASLLRLCQRCASVADKKATIPVLANMLLTATDDSVNVAATDMYQLVTDSAPAEVTTPGSIALPAKELAARVAAMPDGNVQLTLKDHTVTLKSVGSSRKFTLRGVPASEFPTLPEPADGGSFLDVHPDTLSRLIGLVKVSISADETRPHVNSALFEWNKDQLRMVSTDGHRLSKAEATVDNETPATMLIPLRSVTEIAKLVKDAKDVVTMRPGKTHLFLTAGSARFGVKLVEAQFPLYEQVIPKKSERALTVSRAALCGALQAVKLAADARTAAVRLTHAGDVLRVAAASADAGNADDEVDCEATGAAGEMTIGVNANYLVEALSALTCDSVTLSMSAELDPVVLRARGDDGYLAVVMPMKV